MDVHQKDIDIAPTCCPEAALSVHPNANHSKGSAPQIEAGCVTASHWESGVTRHAIPAAPAGVNCNHLKITQEEQK